MDEVIQYIIDGKVSPNDIISWIKGDDKNLLLKALHPSEFVPIFLNFIYTETSRALQVSSHCTVTPIKHFGGRTTKYISPCKNKKNFSKTTKAKTLDFSANYLKDEKNNKVSHSTVTASLFSSAANPDSPSKDFLPMIDDCPTPVKNNVVIQTSTPKHAVKFAIKSPSPVQQISYPKNTLRNSSFGKPSSFSPNGLFECRKSIPVGLSPKFSQRGDYNKRPKPHNLADFIVYDKKQGKKLKKVENKMSFFKNMDENNVKTANVNIANTEEFPPIGGELSPKDKKKRIKPTLVSSSSSDKIFIKKAPIIIAQQSNQNAFQVPEQTGEQSFAIERNLLRIEKEKFLKMETTPNVMFGGDINSQKFHPSILPCFDAVTYREQLTSLAHLYALFIMNNFVPNVTTELFYILKLLTLDGNSLADNLDVKNGCYLLSVHNCVYFSVTVLDHIIGLLSIFDRITLKLLGENSRIALFCGDLHKKIYDMGEHAQPLRIAKGLSKSPILSVSFQSETDNKDNFPSTSAFHIFRKQRDLFYEIIRIWEDDHLNRNWSFGGRLGIKIQQLMTLRNESSNYVHFSRLFQSQLLTMCRGDEQTNNLTEFEEVSCLLQLRQAHPERYKRLHERLVTPFKVGKPVPPPSFPGYQEFFRNFILEARSHAFYCHLKDCFATMLKQLQSTVCMFLDKDDLETHEDHVRNETLTVLQNMKLIAKFLGLVEFLPYYTSETLTETVLASHVQLRNYICPTLPLSYMLQQACVNGCLVVTIPWMVDLLSMADAVAFHTQNYLTLSFLLIVIYKMLPLFRAENISKSKKCKLCLKNPQINTTLHDFNSVNSLYLKVLLGWLFSLPNFPEGLFYTTVSDAEIDHEEVNKTVDALGKTYRRSCYSCFMLAENKEIEDDLNKAHIFVTPSKGGAEKSINAESTCSPLKTPSKDLLIGMLDTPDKTPMKKSCEIQTTDVILDSWNLLDHQTLLFSCPYLSELKNLLSEFTFEGARSKSTSGIRKITPLTTTEKINDSSTKTLQVQLEENFFHNQPSSVKKTVDFTVERIFSNILKFARNELVPRLRESCLKDLNSSVLASDDWLDATELRAICEDFAKEKSELIIVQIRGQVHDKASSLLDEDKTSVTLSALLPPEITQVCLSSCCKIVKRIVIEKVNHWLGNQLVSDFCLTEFISAAKKSAKIALAQHQNTTNSSEPSFNQSLMMESMSDTLNNSTAILSSKLKTKIDDQPFILPKVHNNMATVPSKLLNNIKASLRKLYTNNETHPLTVEELNSLLVDVQSTINGRRDMTAALFKAIQCIYAEWIAALCVVVPDHIDEDVLLNLLRFWINEDGSYDTNNNLLCVLSPKTFMLLAQKEDSVQDKAWLKLRILLKKLLAMKLIDVDKVNESFIILMRHSWPQKMLSEISILVSVVSNHGGSPNEDTIDSDLLDWVGWVCSEMENVD